MKTVINKEENNSGESKTKLVLCLICGLALLVCCSCMIAVSIHASVKSKAVKLKPAVCVNCSELTQNGTIPGSDQLLAKMIKSDDSSQCCVKDSDSMSAFLEWQLSQSVAEEEPLLVFDPQNFTLSKASAHRRLVPMDWYRRKTVKFFDKDLELGFRHAIVDSPFAQHERNVTIDTDGAKIELPGNYLVYSSIHFIPSIKAPCKNFGEQTWYQHVKRLRAGNTEPEILLTGSFTCGDNVVRVHETSYIAGVFHLQTDDHLRVYISGMGLVSYQVESSFMGLVMLGDDDLN